MNYFIIIPYIIVADLGCPMLMWHFRANYCFPVVNIRKDKFEI